MDSYIQVGTMALRDPVTGDFLPSVPLYIQRTPEADAAEDSMLEDAARSLAACFKKYVDGQKAAKK